jgi:hypothetical protein
LPLQTGNRRHLRRHSQVYTERKKWNFAIGYGKIMKENFCALLGFAVGQGNEFITRRGEIMHVVIHGQLLLQSTF